MGEREIVFSSGVHGFPNVGRWLSCVVSVYKRHNLRKIGLPLRVI